MTRAPGEQTPAFPTDHPQFTGPWCALGSQRASASIGSSVPYLYGNAGMLGEVVASWLRRARVSRAGSSGGAANEIRLWIPSELIWAMKTAES